MMATAGYVQRLGRVFEALQVLDLYPSGLTLSDLATLLGCRVEDVRLDLMAHNNGTDLGPEGFTDWVEFLAHLPADDEAPVAGQPPAHEDTSDDDDDLLVSPREATAVRLHRSGVKGRSGGLTLADIGAILLVAEDLARVEPGNAALTEVIAQLRSRWLPAVTEVWRPSYDRLFEADLTDAIEQRRRVRIVYERTWRPGVIERVIEPYQLVRTQRGFEVDAGPVQDNDRIRSYLVNQVRALEVLDEHFDRPSHADALCAANRRATEVRIVLPKDRQWVTEFLAERVEVVEGDDDVSLRLEVIEPVAARVGLVLLQAGPEAFVVEPKALADADHDVALELLAHHDLLPEQPPAHRR
ncbi:MAG: proteasome accessory factor [Actinomycetota bacterium]|nr:proteasome accessory factor [Actinomycetota bacterium]